MATENDFYRYIKLKHEVLAADWTDDDCKWRLRVRDLNTGCEFDDPVDIFIELNGPVRWD